MSLPLRVQEDLLSNQFLQKLQGLAVKYLQIFRVSVPFLLSDSPISAQ